MLRRAWGLHAQRRTSPPGDLSVHSSSAYQRQNQLLLTEIASPRVDGPIPRPPLARVSGARFAQFRFRPRRPSRPAWMLKRHDLIDFRPANSPFVPPLVTALVNKIEAHHAAPRSATTEVTVHDRYFSSATKGDVQRARQVLQRFLNADPEESDELDVLLDDLPLHLLTEVLREFFSLLPRRLLFVQRRHLDQLRRRPLYDALLRVSPALRSLIAQLMARMPRVRSDTFAFMMIHALHLWEYSSVPHIAQGLIADAYGHMLVALERPALAEEKTMLCRRNGGVRTAESAIMLALMDATDTVFWDRYSGGQRVVELFHSLTPFEEKRRARRRMNESRRVSTVLRDGEPLVHFPMCIDAELMPAFSPTDFTAAAANQRAEMRNFGAVNADEDKNRICRKKQSNQSKVRK